MLVASLRGFVTFIREQVFVIEVLRGKPHSCEKGRYALGAAFQTEPLGGRIRRDAEW